MFHGEWVHSVWLAHFDTFLEIDMFRVLFHVTSMRVSKLEHETNLDFFNMDVAAILWLHGALPQLYNDMVLSKWWDNKRVTK